MADFKKIAADMVAQLRAEGATVRKVAAVITEVQRREFAGRFVEAARASTSIFWGSKTYERDLDSWIRMMPEAIELIVGRGPMTDKWRLFEYILLGGANEPGMLRRLSEQYRKELALGAAPAEPSIDLAAIRTKLTELAALIPAK